MKLESYWTDSAPAFEPAARCMPAQVDVAIVGGGFTGLSAALALARRGASVVVLEAGERVAAEASGRNGGHVNNGLAVDYAEVAAKVGAERARGWYRAYDAAVDTVERIVREEAIDCDFLRTRQAQARDEAGAARRTAAQRRAAGRATASTPTSRSSRPSACAPRSPATRFHGGLLYKRSGQMHMGRFAYGLAAAAERRGAQIHTGMLRAAARAPGSAARRTACTPTRGTLRANQVLLATGAARHGGYGSFGWLRRRIVPIGSFIVVTEPLGRRAREAPCSPGAAPT